MDNLGETLCIEPREYVSSLLIAYNDSGTSSTEYDETCYSPDLTDTENRRK